MRDRSRLTSEHAFDTVASLYEAWFDDPLGRLVDELEKDLIYQYAVPGAGTRALDAGTGTGHFAADLAAKCNEVVGLDLSPQMLDVARRKQGSLHWLRGDMAALPFDDATFDLVLSVTALEFVASPERAVGEMWRVLRPAGNLVVATLNRWSPWAWARRRESRQAETPFSHANFPSPCEFVRLLRRLGPVQWSSSVFVGPGGGGMKRAWELERPGRALLPHFGALLVGRVNKCS